MGLIKKTRTEEGISLTELSDSGSIFKTVFSSINIPAVIVDDAGLVIHANKAFVEMSGASPGLVNQKKYLVDFISSSTKHALADLLCKLKVYNNKPVTLEIRLEDSTGYEKLVGCTLDKIAKSKLFLITFTVRNDNQKSFDNKHKTNELENLFLLISHSLKSPIVSIQGFTNVLIENHASYSDEEIKYYLERILKNNSRLEKMVHDLLEFSKSAKRINTRKKVSLNDIVMNVCIDYHIRIKSKSIKINIPRQLPEVLCDNESMGTVFCNLIDNAIKYLDSRENPEIEIGYEDKNRFYVFWIKDNGIGVAEDYQENVFNLFQRAEAPNHIEGTGVGLAIVKRIVENHGGLTRMSSKVGEGTTIYFTLPKLVEN